MWSPFQAAWIKIFEPITGAGYKNLIPVQVLPEQVLVGSLILLRALLARSLGAPFDTLLAKTSSNAAVATLLKGRITNSG